MSHDRCTALHTAAEKGINTKRTSLIYSFFSQDMCWFPVQSLLLPFSLCGGYKWNIYRIGYYFGESVVEESIHKHNCRQWHHIQEKTKQAQKFSTSNFIAFCCV